MPTRIVTYVHRPKRPPRKRKAVAITGPAIVTTASRRAPADTPPVDNHQAPAAPPPAKDDTPAEPGPPAAKSAIVTPGAPTRRMHFGSNWCAGRPARIGHDESQYRDVRCSADAAIYAVSAWCRACRHTVHLDLPALVAGGHGDVPLTHLPLRCRCGSDQFGVIVGAVSTGKWQAALGP